MSGRKVEPLRAPRPGRTTVEIDPELLEEVRDAVVFLSGPPHRLTMRELFESALRRELQRLRQEALGGDPFPARAHDVRPGRPLN